MLVAWPNVGRQVAPPCSLDKFSIRRYPDSPTSRVALPISNYQSTAKRSEETKLRNGWRNERPSKDPLTLPHPKCHPKKGRIRGLIVARVTRDTSTRTQIKRELLKQETWISWLLVRCNNVSSSPRRDLYASRRVMRVDDGVLERG